MSPAAQALDGGPAFVSRDQIRLDVHNPATVPVPARPVECLLRIHPVIHCGQHDLKVPLWLHMSTHYPEGADGLATAGEKARDDGVERALARRDHIG